MRSMNYNGVDEYLTKKLVKEPEFLSQVNKRNELSGLPQIEVSPSQGQFLYLLAKMSNAKRILEIGTLGGYSTLWLAQALPSNGQIVTLEINAEIAAIAQENFKASPYNDLINVEVGPAADTLKKMSDKQTEAFDMIFIDADKENNPTYLKLVQKLSHSGSIIISDNIVRDGEVANESSTDERVIGVQKYIEELDKNDAYESVGIITAGIKGIDGFSLSIVK